MRRRPPSIPVRRRAATLCIVLTSACAAPLAGRIVDAHVHVEPDGTRARIRPQAAHDPAALLVAMNRAGVARAFLLAVPSSDEVGATRALHDQIAASLRTHPGRFVGIASVQPSEGEAGLRELERVAALGFRGVKLAPTRLELDAPEVHALVARATQLRLIIYVDGWWPQATYEVGRLALAHPTTHLVLAHAGGVRFQDLIVFRVLELYPFYPRNVWFDLSSVATLFEGSPFADQLRWVCRQIGTDRVLFGSDHPLTSMEDAIAAVHALGFMPSEEEQIFVGNVDALLK